MFFYSQLTYTQSYTHTADLLTVTLSRVSTRVNLRRWS